MNYARNYENLLNFVKGMPKILVVPFFWTRRRVTVQVWSQVSAPASLSSSDIVMKSQSWLQTGEDARIVLTDSEGKVNAGVSFYLKLFLEENEALIYDVILMLEAQFCD